VRGHRPGPIDGIYGRQTRSALNRFEKKEKLTMSSGNSLYFRSIERLGIAC
jgi:peptidoglycan hydrolase-like protein with peptidoglycan-binding domain